MRVVRSALDWLGRRTILYLALVAAIGFATFALPWIKREVAGGGIAAARHFSLRAASQQIDRDTRIATTAFRSRTGAMRRQNIRVIDGRIAVLERQKIALDGQVAQAPSRWMLALSGANAVLAIERARLSLILVDQELAGLHSARELISLDGRISLAAVDADAWRAAALASISSCTASRNAQIAFEQRWQWRVRSWFDNTDHRRLVAARTRLCREAKRNIAGYNRVARTRRELAVARRDGERQFERIVASVNLPLAGFQSAMAADERRADVEWRGSLGAKARLWAERLRVNAILRQAAAALIVILLTPYLIRVFCYLVLAPIAMRRAAIRIQAPACDSAVVITPSQLSQTSICVRPDANQELLVRQDYLQSSSHGGSKSTQWLLDWRHPVTSVATGLFFLTRIRGEGDMTIVSAVRDPFAEVALLQLPKRAACVLQPRAVAAVVQPIGNPIRVSTRWRLFSLNAWLTMQLRYVIFHGPAKVVIKGGRGVRIEMCERGRVFGQAQMIGFSADLAYSVTRTETFWPYFFGREALLKDRVEGGGGVVILEEAPGAGLRGSEMRHGIEGMIDAFLKVFGL